MYTICFIFINSYLHPLLATSDYGYVDLIQTYVSLLVPIIVLRFDSAVFRFLIDCRENDNEKSKVISSSMLLILIQLILATFIFILFNTLFSFDYWIAIVFNIIFISLSSVLLQLSRGLGRNIDYSVASIISAAITVVMNIVFIILLGWNASSILYASAVANLFCSIYLILKTKIYRNISLKSISKLKLREMLSYSLPMIPDGLSWWIVNVSDRTIISFLIGTSANGVYAISSKFSNILSSIFQIFNMSWQESASLHINDKDRDEFFTDILNQTYLIFFSICIFILVCMPFVFYIFIGDRYLSAYKYIPLLLLGNLYNALANVSGGVYIAKKETSQVARTTIIAALINIVINLITIRKFGLYAASFSTLIAYIVIALYRYIDVKKYVNMKINIKVLILTNLVFAISSIVYYVNSFILSVINLLIITVTVFMLNRKYIFLIYTRIKKGKEKGV